MKKLLRFAGVALLALTIGVVGCDDDEPVTPVAPVVPAPIFGTVSGTVSVEGSGLAGVSVNLVGAASQSASTGPSGGYSFGNVPAGTHGVQISGAPVEVAFVSTATVVTIITSGQTVTADFSGNYIRTSSITGSVTAGGEGVVATVTATGGGMLMSERAVVGSSDTDGNFELTGLRAGTYHVTISDFGDIEFPVTTRDVTVGVGLSANVSFDAAGEDGPTTDTGVFLLITGVTDEDDADGKISGRVTAVIDIERERGDARFEKIALYVDGAEVVTQLFGLPPAPAADAAELAQQVVFSLSFDSDEFDPETGAVTYSNGTHGIVAGVTVVGSEAEDYSQQWDVELENDDGYVVTADLGDNSEIGDDGRRWYGGPSNGTIDITALPVSYSGGSVTSVSANFCGEDATDSDGSDGYTFEFECEGRESNTDADEGAVGDMLAISSAGTDGKILGDNPFPAFVDFVGPTESPIIVANPNGREMGWINSAVSLSAERKKATDDALLFPGDDGTGGIGGYNMAVRVGKDLKAALAAAVASSVPAESAANDSYCAIASATDDLGNESGLPDADDDTCRAAPAGGDALVNHDNDAMTPDVYGYDETPDVNTDMVTDLSGQTLKFGVDTTAPTIEFGDDYDDDNRHNEIPGAFEFEPEDDQSNVGNSGLHSTDGLLVGIRRRNTSKTECLTIAADGAVAADAAVDADCDNTAITDEDVTLVTGVDVAYYTLSGMAQDAAGNSSDAISHTFVYDNDVATATAPSVPGVIEAGKPFDGASFLNDDLSIRDYYGAANFATVLSIGIGLPIAVDEFDASPLTNRNHTVSATVDTYAGLQSQEGGSVQALSGATVAVRDQTQATYTSMSTPTFTVQDAPDTDDGFPATNADGGFSYAFVFPGTTTSYSATTVCGIAECDDSDSETSLKIEVKASATESGTFSNPFERVDFLITDINGVSWTVGSDASGTSGRIGGGNRNRTWSYSITLPGTMLRAATRPMAGGDVTPMIRAIAVNDNNVGLLGSTAMPTFDTTP